LPSEIIEPLSLSANANPTVAAAAGSKLRIRKEGEVVPLESTLEIKTQVFHKRLETRDVASQFWVSQTPKLVRAYHRKGFFQEPEVEDVTAAVKRWEEDSQEDLRKLASLVNRILTMAKELGESTVMKYDAMADRLVIAKVAGKKMLPTDLYSKWDDASVEPAVSRDPRTPDTSLTKYRRCLKSHQQMLQKPLSLNPPVAPAQCPSPDHLLDAAAPRVRLGQICRKSAPTPRFSMPLPAV